ncbi:MAG TPA: hypothetical protein VGR93_08080, partial [Candidatus Acidoferrales bacterium]|nr:hypothetical protein [Candidatus Acidoferrales bacterium]
MAPLAAPFAACATLLAFVFAATFVNVLASSRIIATPPHPLARSASPPPTFYKDVLPILQQHCQVCHRAGEIAPMPLVTYAQTRSYAAKIKDKVTRRLMPPWFA